MLTCPALAEVGDIDPLTGKKEIIPKPWDVVNQPSIEDLQISADEIVTEKLDVETAKKLKFGFVDVEWSLPPDTIMGPFPFRLDTNYVLFPPRGQGSYHTIEVWAALKSWLKFKG
jgi:hypothetical protein